MKLSDYAKSLGISYKNAWKISKWGEIKASQFPTGTIIVTTDKPNSKGVAIYSNPIWFVREIGNNKNWKQFIKIDKNNNQNFLNIPHEKLVKQFKYKVELVGIKVLVTEESYTSKCSFLDLEPIKKQQNYLGRKIKRDLFKGSSGYIYSADVNGSLNIGRKVVGESVFDRDSIVSFVVKPLRVKSYKASWVGINVHKISNYMI